MAEAETSRIQKTELGNGKAIIVFTAPKAGKIRTFAIFEGPVTHKPGTARFIAKLNGVAVSDQSDYDFSNYHMGCDATVSVNANTTVTFDTYRANTGADTKNWEMWLEYRAG